MPEIQIPDGFEHDCTKCEGLCCSAHIIKKSKDFPEDKDGGVPCHLLSVETDGARVEYRCRVFATLEQEQRRLCREFTCMGAGNAVSTFFRELGIEWGVKPEDVDDKSWQIKFQNMQTAYLVLYNVMTWLDIYRHGRQPEYFYPAAKAEAQKIAKRFSKVLQETTEVIAFDYWGETEFKNNIRLAVHDANNEHLLKKLGMPKWW